MKTIEIRNLTKDYGQGRGVFNLDFSVQEGEVFGYLGPNGAGKTTTIRHLMGFLSPGQGRCRINGMDCRRRTAAIQRNLGYIPGEIAFPEGMTGRALIRFLARYRGMRDTGRAAELMDRFDLDAGGRLRKMSKGMKQKVGIVCALMHDPAVLILDEPTSGLDPLMQNRFIELVQEERRRGKTILMSSHMFEEIERTCTRVGIIRQGRLVAVEGIDTLKAGQRQKYVVTLASEEAARAFAAEALPSPVAEGRRVSLTVQNGPGELIAVMARYPVLALETPSQSLEEIFLQYYGEEAHHEPATV